MGTAFQLEKRFESNLRLSELVHEGDFVLLAVSGGIDSMVLLSLFLSIRKRWNLSLGVLHVNHQLRGKESLADEEFVRRQAARRKIPVHIIRADVAGLARKNRCSLQEAAREIRYAFFEETRRQTGANAVATAHHSDDNAETVLMNAFRGAGIRGLSGIPLRREPGVIRPLLFASRSEIARYARGKHVPSREDSSNASLKYLRNLVRRFVIPRLQKKLGPNVSESLNRLSAVTRALSSRLEEEIKKQEGRVFTIGPGGRISIHLPSFGRVPRALQEEVVLHLLRRLRIEPSAEKVSRIMGLRSSQTGRSLRLSAGVSVSRNREELIFEEPAKETPFSMPVKIGQHYEIGGYVFAMEKTARVPKVLGGTPYTEFVDAGSLGSRLTLRSWRAGDRFVPLGMHTKKKLSDFFTDQKILLREKHITPILESDGKIVWVCGKRLDERFKVTPSTRAAVKLTFRPQHAQ